MSSSWGLGISLSTEFSSYGSHATKLSSLLFWVEKTRIIIIGRCLSPATSDAPCISDQNKKLLYACQDNRYTEGTNEMGKKHCM